MFDIGFQELVLISALGLLVLGPERLPRVVAQLGQWVGKARRMARTVSSQIRDEMDVDLQSVIDPEAHTTTPYRRPGVETLKPAAPLRTSGEGAAGSETSPQNPPSDDG